MLRRATNKTQVMHKRTTQEVDIEPDRTGKTLPLCVGCRSARGSQSCDQCGKCYQCCECYQCGGCD